MSLKTWLEEFYPISAKDAPKGQAAAHSLRKWQGLLPENLAKHGVDHVDTTLGAHLVGVPGWHTTRAEEADRKPFAFSGNTCALCFQYQDDAADTDYGFCCGCPLYQISGSSCAHSGSPYERYVESGTEKARLSALHDMLDCLEKAVHIENDLGWRAATG